MIDFHDVSEAMTIKMDEALPEKPLFVDGIRRAPKRSSNLSPSDVVLAVKNALRYIHPRYHTEMAEVYGTSGGFTKATACSSAFY